MALTIHDRLRRAALNGILAELNVGSADAGGDCVLRDASDVEVAALTFGNPAFAPATSPGGGVAEAQTNTMGQDDTITPGATFTKIQWRDRDNTVLIAGTVGLPNSGADMILNSNTIPPDAEAVSSPGLSAALILI